MIIRIRFFCGSEIQEAEVEISSLVKNRRGDVPITILVIGVFAVCTMALLSFSLSVGKLNKSFSNLETLEKANIQIEQNPGVYYYDEIVKDEFSLNLDFDFFKEVVVFSVEYFGTG